MLFDEKYYTSKAECTFGNVFGAEQPNVNNPYILYETLMWNRVLTDLEINKVFLTLKKYYKGYSG